MSVVPRVLSEYIKLLQNPSQVGIELINKIYYAVPVGDAVMLFNSSYEYVLFTMNNSGDLQIIPPFTKIELQSISNPRITEIPDTSKQYHVLQFDIEAKVYFKRAPFYERLDAGSSFVPIKIPNVFMQPINVSMEEVRKASNGRLAGLISRMIPWGSNNARVAPIGQLPGAPPASGTPAPAPGAQEAQGATPPAPETQGAQGATQPVQGAPAPETQGAPGAQEATPPASGTPAPAPVPGVPQKQQRGNPLGNVMSGIGTVLKNTVGTVTALPGAIGSRFRKGKNDADNDTTKPGGFAKYVTYKKVTYRTKTSTKGVYIVVDGKRKYVHKFENVTEGGKKKRSSKRLTKA